jgi:DNA repair protein RadC
MVKIKDLPRVDRPREKLLKYGPTKLTTTELLAILLRTGIKGKNVIQLSNQILKLFGTEKIKQITIEDLKKIKGLGSVKAAEIVACIELGNRLLKEKQPLEAISPQAVFDSLKDIRSLKKEHFIAIYLDTRNQEIAREIISIGTLNASLVHPREIFEPAIRNLAASIILVHNHPSGDLKPSHEDLLITKKLVDSGNLLDIHVLDHIIITGADYTSFKQRKLI